MAAQSAVQVGSGFIRVIAKTLPEDYNRFKQQWQQGIEQALSGINLSTPIISNQVATHQGQQAGQHIAQGAQQAVQQQAPQITAPIASQGSSVGAALGKGIVAGVAAFKAGELVMKGLGTAVEANDIGSKLQASMGLSAKDAAKFQDSMKNLFGGGYTATMEEASVAIEATVSSIDGMKTASNEAVESMTKKVLTLSNAFELDAGRSAQIMGQLVKSGLTKSADESADILTGILQKLPSNIRESALDALDEYAPFMKGLGLNAEDAGNLIIKASEKGEIGIDKLGDGLKEFTIRATDMSEQTIQAYGAIGVDATKMTAGVLKGGEAGKAALQEVVNGLLKMEDPAQRSAAALALFGSPLEDMNVSEIPQFLKGLQLTNNQLGETKGAAEKAGDALNSGLTFETQKLKNSFQLALGEIAIPLLTSILPIVQSVAKWIGENKDLIVQWGGPLLAIGVVLGTIVAAVSAFQVVAGVLGPVIAALTAAQFTWNAALFASPLFIWTTVILGVILAIMLLATHWEQVTQFIGDSINWIGERLQELADWFGSVFEGIGNLLSGKGWSGEIHVSGGSGGGLPMFANGGLLPATPGGQVYSFVGGEAGQNEIVMNEGLYNKNTEAQTKLIESVTNNNAGSGPAVVQQNYFPNVNPREVEAILVGQVNQQSGRK